MMALPILWVFLMLCCICGFIFVPFLNCHVCTVDLHISESQGICNCVFCLNDSFLSLSLCTDVGRYFVLYDHASLYICCSYDL